MGIPIGSCQGACSCAFVPSCVRGTILANTTKQGLAGARAGFGLCCYYEDCHAIDIAGHAIIATWNMSLFFVARRRWSL